MLTRNCWTDGCQAGSQNYFRTCFFKNQKRPKPTPKKSIFAKSSFWGLTLYRSVEIFGRVFSKIKREVSVRQKTHFSSNRQIGVSPRGCRGAFWVHWTYILKETRGHKDSVSNSKETRRYKDFCQRDSRSQGFSKSLEVTWTSKETRGHMDFKRDSRSQGLQKRLEATRILK